MSHCRSGSCVCTTRHCRRLSDSSRQAADFRSVRGSYLASLPALSSGRTPGDVPCPHLAGCESLIAGRFIDFQRCPATPAMMHLAVASQDPVKRRFAGQIDPGVRQTRHDLRRRQTGILRLVTHGQYLMFFGECQLIGRSWAHRRRPAVFGLPVPAPPGTQADAHFPTGGDQARTGARRLAYPPDKLHAFVRGRQSSSSAIP